MEKRKVFKISIIDKEISRTEFDRNTFYTSDSELSLVFKLIEKDYSYEHGEILLYNEDDESFVTRQITKQENDFVYELESDIIPHYGTWKAQLQLVNDGDVYTSKPFEFSIVNDLSNLAPQPTLTDINNWSTLKQSAAELIDEMLTVIDDIKKAESKHENAEMIRQRQENDRVQSESERQSQERVRSQGENQRQSKENKRIESENERRLKEIERNKNESNRQTIFENNEVRRKETFNANEATRQEKETARQQAETQRVSAESNRVNAEEQRKIDHENRSAKLEGKADKVVIENLIVNGAFSEGTTGWVKGGYQSEIEVTDGVAKTVNFDVNNRSFIQTLPEQPHIGDMIYVSIKTRIDHPDKFINMFILKNYLASSKNIIAGPITNVTREFMRFSGTIRHEDIFILRIIYVFNETGEYPAYLDDVVAINLTETFGAGNEPTKEEMDELIKVTGYIDGEYALNNKEMLIWTLALIRSNRNAIISLGGTV